MKKIVYFILKLDNWNAIMLNRPTFLMVSQNRRHDRVFF